MSVKVGGMRYSVEVINPNIPNPAELMGFTEFEPLRIGIKHGMSPDRMEWVAWHEFVHAIVDTLSGEQDEDNVRMFGNAFYSFLKENDLLRDGWFEKIVDSDDGNMPSSSGKVVIDRDDTAVEQHRQYESLRGRDNAEEVSAPGGE